MATKTASFLGPQAPQVGQMADLGMEQQMLLKALTEQSEGLAPGATNTGKLSVVNLEGIANALAQRRTKAGLTANREAQGKARSEYQAALAEALRQYQPGSLDSLHAARSSPFPELRERAGEDLKAFRERAGKLTERASFATATASEDPTKWAPRQTTQVSDGTVLGLTEGAPPVKLGGGWQPTTLADGSQAQRNELTGKVDQIAKNPQVNVNMGGKALDEAMKLLPDDYRAARSYASTVRNTEQALDALKQGARTGYGEQFFQNARTLIGGLTGVQFDATTPTGVLAKTLAKNVLDEFGGKLGNQISNADRVFMEVAEGGLNDDPKALERILAIRAALAIKSLDLHNQNIEDLASSPENKVGSYTRRRWSVERPQFKYSFATPDADASFRATLGGMPLDNARALNAQEASGAKPPSGQPAISDLVRKYGGKP